MRKSLLWWLKHARRSLVRSTNICPTCRGVGMVRFQGRAMSADGLYLQWALVCDPCQGTGQVQEPQPARPPQAIRMAPGWNALPKVSPRPLRMSKQSERPSNVIPFALVGPEAVQVPPYPQWNEDTAQLLVEWAEADALRDKDSGDEQREQA